MKSDALPKNFPASGDEWDRLIAEAPEQVDDPECPYDPNDPAAVEEFWRDAVATRGGGPNAVRKVLKEREDRRSGPEKVPPKIKATLPLSPEVLDYFRSTGEGWQARIDAALKEWIARRDRS